MRLTTLTLSIVLSLFFLTANAQDVYVFGALEGYEMPGANACKNLKVIDTRKQKNNIGYLKKGMFNRKVDVITAKPLDVFLQTAYENMHPGNSTSNDELLLVLHQMEIKDMLEGDESGTFFFSGDFFRGSNGKYSFLASVDSLYEIRASVDVTRNLISNTQLKLYKLLEYYAVKQEQNSEKLYTAKQATTKRADDKLTIPVYNTKEYKKGIYYTADQFLNQTPVDTPFQRKTYTRDGGIKVHYFYYENSKGKKDDRIKECTFFAIYDGENWWVPNVTYSSIMKWQDGDFYANRFFNQPYKGSYGDANMFGLIGGLIVEGIDAATEPRDKSKKRSWGLYASRFNPTTKEFIPIDRPRFL